MKSYFKRLLGLVALIAFFDLLIRGHQYFISDSLLLSIRYLVVTGMAIVFLDILIMENRLRKLEETSNGGVRK